MKSKKMFLQSYLKNTNWVQIQAKPLITKRCLHLKSFCKKCYFFTFLFPGHFSRLGFVHITMVWLWRYGWRRGGWVVPVWGVVVRRIGQRRWRGEPVVQRWWGYPTQRRRSGVRGVGGGAGERRGRDKVSWRRHVRVHHERRGSGGWVYQRWWGTRGISVGFTWRKQISCKNTI